MPASIEHSELACKKSLSVIIDFLTLRKDTFLYAPVGLDLDVLENNHVVILPWLLV